MGPSYNFPLGDPGTSLPIMVTNHQVPHTLNSPLATIHESAYSRKSQVISPSCQVANQMQQPKLCPLVDSSLTGRDTLYKYFLRPGQCPPVFSTMCHREFPVRPEVQLEGNYESSAFVGKRSAENRSGGVWGKRIPAHPRMCKFFTFTFKWNDSSASFLLLYVQKILIDITASIPQACKAIKEYLSTRHICAYF